MNTQASELNGKKEMLLKILKGFSSLGVAFSGGVDSTLLLATAVLTLKDRVVAMTAFSATHSTAEKDHAIFIAQKIGARHILFNTDEMDVPEFILNNTERCYHCKKVLFKTMRRHAEKIGIEELAHGANVDDLSDFRPGFKAAQESGIQAPLIDAGLNKEQIRLLALQMGLPNWDRPAMACLATRIPYGTPISTALLRCIEQAEARIKELGIPVSRVRHHGNLARIEVAPEHMSLFLEPPNRKRIATALRELGYDHICLDLEGYVSGKMNRGLD